MAQQQKCRDPEVKVVELPAGKEQTMKSFALVLLFTLVLLNCFSSAQTPPINVGKCTNMSWSQNCSTAGAPICPNGVGSCTMVITDNGNGQAIATPQGGSPTTYICVQAGTTIVWQEGSGESFVVSFGSSTTPFPNIPVFTGNTSAPAQGQIANPASSVPECNEYVILHCGPTSCTTGDPVVVVHGGQTMSKPKDHDTKEHKDQ
jgi:hypothetical protein